MRASRRAFDFPGELGRGQRGAVHDVVLADLEPVEPEVGEGLADDDGARRDHRGPVGVLSLIHI